MLLSRDFEVDLATETRMFDAAFRLVHDQYTWRGYMMPAANGRRLSLHNALPSTRVFVATRANRVIGTLTLVQDSLFGLPMDDLYRGEVAELRAQGRRVGEVSALATAAECRRAGVSVLLHLMRMLVTYAVKVVSLDDLCITVNPRHVEFYHTCLKFEPLGGERAYDKVNGAPAVALRLDLDVARGVEAAVRRGEDTDPVHQFLFARPAQDEVLGQLHRQLPRAHFRREQFVEFFGDGILLQQVPEAWRARLESFYAPILMDRPCELHGADRQQRSLPTPLDAQLRRSAAPQTGSRLTPPAA
jgi:hypothetical protein